MQTSYSIPQATSKAQYTTVEDILKGRCPECGGELTIAYFHVGGHPNDLPFVVCDNPDGGYAHLRVPASAQVTSDYWDIIEYQDRAFSIWEEFEAEQEAAQ